MKNIVGLLILSLFLSACSKNADVGNLPGTPKNNRPEQPSPTTPATYAELEWSLPIIAFTPTVVNTTKEQVVSLKNKGTAATAPLVLSWGDSNTPFAIKTGTNNCEGQVLQPGQSCSLTISYTPSFNGSRSNVLLGTDLIVSKALIINGTANGGASGDGTSSSKLVWILDDYGFGPTALGGNKTFDLILANVGGTTSQNLNLTLEDSGTPFTLVPGFNFCENQSLSPGANCKVRVKFNPTMVGDFTNVLKATDGLQNDTMDLAGTGIVINSQLVFNPTSYSFNQVLIGGQKTLDVKLKNNAAVNSGVISLTWANSNHYNIITGLDQCSGQILPGGAECTVRVRFAPTAVGTELGNVLTADDGSSSSTVSFVGNGADPASLLPVAFDQILTAVEDITFNGALTGLEPQGLPFTYIIVGNPTKGNLTLLNSNTGEFRYIPDLNTNGSDTFTFRVKNANNEVSGVGTITLNVMPINDPPVAHNDTATVAEDSFVNINVLANDVDVESDILTVMSVSQPAKGMVLINGDNSIRYTPNMNYFGTDSFTYVVSDGKGGTASALVTVTVTPVNDAPVANDMTLAVNEDSSVNAQLQVTDVDSTALTYIIVTPPAHGELVITNAVTGAFTYTPDSNYHGSDSFTFKANDGFLDSNIATVSFTVNSINDLPVASNSSFTTNEDTAHNGSLTANDPDGDTLTYSVVTQGTKGSVTITNSATGAFTYTPSLNKNGSDSFTFRVFDGTGYSNTATVIVTITPVNDAPVADNATVNMNEDTTYNGTLSATDVEGSPLTYILVGNVTHGTLTLNSNGSYTYKPSQDYVGADSFTFKVNDGDLDSNTATVSITVNTYNTLPVANTQSITTDEDTPYTGTLTATDADGDALVYSVVSNGAKGVVVITNSATGAFTYTPNLNQNGNDAFSFRVNDGTGNSNTATVSVMINPVNDAPTAIGDSYSTNRNQAKNIVLVGSDVEGSPLTYTVVTSPTKGVLSGTPPNLVYTPNNNQTGADSFTFKVNDGQLDSAPATINVTIDNSNVLPVAQNSTLTTNEDTAKTGNVTATDADGDALTYSVVNNPTKGVLTWNSNGSYSYTPNLNLNGSDSFTFRANDGFGNSNTATVTITITPVNDAPVANNWSINTQQNTAVGFTLTGSDVDGDSLTYTIVSGPSKGVISGTAPNLTYTPNFNAKGSDSFTFRVNDGTVNSNTATVSINIEDIGNWFNTNWTHRRKILLNNSSYGALTNFPVMVKIDSSRIDYSKTKSGGADLRFTDSNGNLLSFEIERWNSSGTSTVWVKVPSVSANSTNEFIFMYYGNSSASDGQNKTDVWSNGYVAVYHLEETTGFPKDSTASDNDVTSSAGSISMNVSGKLAGGDKMNSTSTTYRVPDSNSLDITNQLTMEAWVYQTSTSSYATVMAKEGSNSTEYGLLINNGKISLTLAGTSVVEYSSSISNNTWTHIAATFNTSTNVCKVYASGGDTFKQSTSCTTNISATSGQLRIGNRHTESNGFVGTLDELRISNVERSSDWIQVQRASANDSYLVFTSEQNTSNATSLKSMILVVNSNQDDGYVEKNSINSSVAKQGNTYSCLLIICSDRESWGYYRMQLGESIPVGANIFNATLNLYGKNSENWNSSTRNLNIQLQNSASAGVISSSNTCPGCGTNIPTVAGSVNWNTSGLTWLINSWNVTPNLSSLVSTLKSNQNGLTAGNYLQFWLTRKDSYGNSKVEVEAEDFANEDTNHAYALIEWTE